MKERREGAMGLRGVERWLLARVSAHMKHQLPAHKPAIQASVDVTARETTSKDSLWRSEIWSATCQTRLSLCKRSVSSAAGEGSSSTGRAGRQEEKGVGKPEKDRLADKDDSLSATVNNTTSSSSILSFLLYFKLVGSLPPS